MKLEGVIYCGDNLYWMSRLPDEFVDLCYIDPPFFSNRNYEVIFGDGEEIRSFEDRWKGGIENYIDWMRDRVKEIHRLLKPTGSFYLHCDWHASHHLKVMCDNVFGERNFRNEIVWKRRYGTFSTVHESNKFGSCTDSIFFYVKTKDAPFHPQYSFSDKNYQEYVDRTFKYVDESGRRYRIADLANPAPRPNLMYEYKGYKPPKNGWAISREKMEQWDKEGRLHFPKNPNGRIQRKRFLDELKGKPVQNLWDDIKMVSSQSAERLGYPTQKPEALLERIIKASSNPYDLVFDCFCACGTTLSVARKLGRRWLGVDVSPTGCRLVQHRLSKLGIRAEIIGLPRTIEELKQLKPIEFQNWVIGAAGGRVSDRMSRDMGIDGYTFYGLYGEKEYPIAVKRMDKVGRIWVDNFETAMRRKGYNKGYIVAFDFTRDAHEEVARAKSQEGLDIELVKVGEISKRFREGFMETLKSIQ